MRYDKTKATSADVLLPYERLIHLGSFTTQKNGLRVCEILDQSGPVLQQNDNFQSIFACSTSAIRPGGKSSKLLSLIGSPLAIRTFQ